MTEIIVSKYDGFCSGVQSAVDTAHKCAPVYILGELTHNEYVLKKLKEEGSKTVDSIEDVPDGSAVLFRSHGEAKRVYDRAREKGLKITDCTCPFVKRTQTIVLEHYNAGYKIIIIGESTHPEVIGINGWCDNTAIIVGSKNEEVDISDAVKVCIVVQTTFNEREYACILQNITKDYNKTVEIFKTICYTTMERQEEAKRLSASCDLMIVLGGNHSSNTQRLYEICKDNCQNVIRIASPDELEISNNFNRVGIVVGASTPREHTQEVFLKMENNTEVKAVNNEMEEAMLKLDEKELKFRKGQIVVATISSAADDGLSLYIKNTKKEILLSKDELIKQPYNKEDYTQNSEIQVMIIGLNPVVLSEKAMERVRAEEAEVKEIAEGKIFTVQVTACNKGGLVGQLGSYSIFVPSSQVIRGFIKTDDLKNYVGKTLRLKAEKVESDGRRKQIVASQRVILEAEKAERDAVRLEKEAEFFENIHEEDIVEGKVVRFAKFGAFVEVNGFDCLAHISDLAWTEVNAPSEILEIGKTYEFKVLKIDQDAKKVSIGYKQLQPKPWDTVAERYAIGDVVRGKVVRIVDFGAFVEVEKGIDGLVHISQISYEWLEKPTSVLTVGEEIDAKILNIDVTKQKMTLSIKALMPAPERPAAPEREEREESQGEEKQPRVREARKPREDGNTEKPARKPRAPRQFKEDDDELKEWNEGGTGGISLGELLNQKK